MLVSQVRRVEEAVGKVQSATS